MSSLAERLDTLRREDGKPDIEARQVELASLIRSLSSNELRFLKHHLNPYTFHLDICGRLPSEVLLQICAYLDLEEFLKARCVSRQWYRVFSQPRVLQSVARAASLFAPKTLSNAPDQVPQNRLPPSISEWLLQAASKRIRRLHGQYTSVAARECIKPEDDNNAGGVLSQAAKQYCRGKVAYHLSDRIIAVTDLRTDVTITVMDENRVVLDRWHLSERFVVAITKNPHSIIAFPLDLKHGGSEPKSVRLPSMVRDFFQYEDYVGVITRANEVLIWEIGGILRSLDISIPSRLALFKLRPVGITFHPDNERNVFVMFTGDNTEVTDDHPLSDPIAEILVQEHQLLGQKPVIFHELDLFRSVKVDPDKDYPNREFISLEDNSIGIGIMDMVYIDEDDEDGEHYGRVPPALPKQHPCCHNALSKKAIRPHPSFGCSIENSQQRDVKSFVVVKFDTRLKEFSTQCFHLPNVPGEIPTFAETNFCGHTLFWRNQVVFSYPRSEHDTFTHAIIGVNDCSQPTSDQTSPPNFYGNGRPRSNNSWTPFTWLWYRSKSLVHQWTSTPRRGQRMLVSNFRGDDEFMVWFLPYGYFVWYFGEDPPTSNTSLLETPFPPIKMERIIYNEAVPESDDDEVPIGELTKPLLFHSTKWR